MENLRWRPGRRLRSTIYSSFKGVDFSKDKLVIDKSHSPDAVNMIADEGGYPCTRQGYERMRKYTGKIHGIYGFTSPATGERHLIIHEGTNIRSIHLASSAEPAKDVLLRENVADSDSVSFYMESKLYIITGKEYIYYDGAKIEDVKGKVPLVAVGRNPAGGGGTVISNLNLFSSSWKEGFRGDGKATVYTLLYKDLTEEKVKVTITKGGVKTTYTEGDGKLNFTVNRKDGKVTFGTAPASPDITGEDNVEIEASRKDTPREGQVSGRDKILKAKCAVIYNNTVFLAGSVKGTDFHSGTGDPSYFPDTGYDEVGNNATDIMGYLPLGRYLVIVKEQNEQDPSIFLRHDTIINDMTSYLKEPAVAGVGAVSRKCFCSLRGDPLFLTREGVVAITSNYLTNERICQGRSWYVDARLTREKDLKNAMAAEFKGRYYLFVNGNVYILDAQQDKKYEKNSASYIYQCFFWDNIPATAVYADADELYFGTADGRLCTFTKHEYYENGEQKFVPGEYLDDGKPFLARWSTAMDDDGDYSRRKTVPPNSVSITLKPYLKSDVNVILQPNNKSYENARRINLEVNAFTFSTLVFSLLSFKSKVDFSVPVQIFPAVKRYNALQIILESTSDKPFGVFSITKRWFFLDH